MVQQTYNDGNISVHTRMDDCHSGVIVIETKEPETIREELHFKSADVNNMVKDVYLKSKNVFVKEGFAGYNGDMNLSFGNDGVRLGWHSRKNGKIESEWVSLNPIVNWVFMEMERLQEEKAIKENAKITQLEMFPGFVSERTYGMVSE